MILVLDAGFGGSDELKVNALQTVRARNQPKVPTSHCEWCEAAVPTLKLKFDSSLGYQQEAISGLW